MTPTDATTSAWLDSEDRHTARIIRRHGVYIDYVVGDRPRAQTSFAYTVGLFGWGHPELLVFGLDPEGAAGVLNDVARRIRSGSDYLAGDILSFADWGHRVLVESVPNPGEILFAANRFYRRPAAASVPLLQLTYDDKQRRFPNESGYARAPWIQPRPGAFRA